MRIFKNTNIQFVKNRYYAYAISILILLVGLIGLIINGMNWSIDFTSGVSIELNMKAKDPSVKPLTIDVLRAKLKHNDFKDAEIQYVNKTIGETISPIFNIKVKGSVQGMKEKIINLITKDPVLSKYTQGRDVDTEVISQINEVGPKVGSELRNGAIWAVLIALLLMIIYIWFRFEFTFGWTAILAIFHDVFCIVGIFALTGREITIQIIAALLTIVGYSINDTIVIFDRIREDLKIYRNKPYTEVFNNAMNSTLSRTTITAGTTLFSCLAIYIFGGTVLRDFAFAMTLGIVFGTYSSIFVASNLVIDYFRITKKQDKSLKHLSKKK